MDSEGSFTTPENSVTADSELSPASLFAAFEAAPDAIYLFNADRLLVRTNAAGQALCGTAGSIIARRCCQMFWQTETGDVCVVDRALETGERIEVEVTGAEANQPVSLLVHLLRG